MPSQPKADRKRRIAADIEAAQPAAPGGGSIPPGGSAPPPPPKHLTKRFRRKPDGVWLEKDDDEKPPLWLCSLLELVAETIDDDGCMGTLWTWQDRFGCQRQEVFGRDQLCGEAGEVMRQLAAGGLTLNSKPEGRQGLVEYLTLSSTETRAHVVSRPGWHRIHGTVVYVHADGTVCGRAPVQVVLESRVRDLVHTQQRGSVSQWREAIAVPCIKNSRLILGVCMGFASPLLFFASEDSGGINLFGVSRAGKSNVGLISASVYGGDPNDGGARAAMVTWRQTANSTEATAAKRSDKGLVLDEMGQMESREIGATAYMPASNQGKSRMDRSAALRSPATWRLEFLSTGEITLAAKMADAGPGYKVRAGHQIRLLDLPADAGVGMGVFEDIHDAASADAFARELKEATCKYFGSAFPAYIAYIISKVEKNPITFTDYVCSEMQRLAGAWMAQAGTDNGQVATAARRFAINAVAGNIATAAGLTCWGKTEKNETESEWGMRKCFFAWLRERGTVGNLESLQAVRQLSDLISRHGNARFEYWAPAKDPNPADQTGCTEDVSLREGRTVMNRLGWRKPVAGLTDKSEQYEYYVTPEGMREALIGLDFKSSIKVLAQRGFIKTAKVEIAHSLKPPGAGKQRLYVVTASVISACADDLMPIQDDDA